MKRNVSFVDHAGGAFAVMAAAIAKAHGHASAVAATSSAEVRIPPEITAVLDEIGAAPVDVKHLDARSARNAAELVDVALWGLSLHPGEGELERLALARIARDRIERHIEAMRLD